MTARALFGIIIGSIYKMTDKKATPAKNKLSADWLVSGVLSKLGDSFDKLTGRNWKPSSTLATSELIERLKKLLDAEVRETDGKGRFVPHNIKLKMQWDKFSTDSEDELKKLEYELLAAAIDHINDNRYHTYAPLKVQAKKDYFTEGVKLWASFDEFAPAAEHDNDEIEINVTVPQISVGEFIPPQAEEQPEPKTENIIAEFTAGEKQKSVELKFTSGTRLSVGRTKENDLTLDDPSVSKNHATLMVNQQGKFLVADTGSTNGTFVKGERVAYGRAYEVADTDKVKFGNIEVFFRRVPPPAPFVAEEEEEVVTAMNEQSGSNEKRSHEVEAGKTEAFQTGSYDTEIKTAPRSSQTENQTIASSPFENQISPKDEDYSNGNNEDAAQHTEQGIKLNFEDDHKS
jgi:pSer/pThr/pTyr-binding forkhead associated (FHA) protein